MSANIANTTLSAGAKDDLAVVDVYKQSSTKAINNNAQVTPTGQSVGAITRNDPSKVDRATIAAQKPKGLTVTSTIELIDRLSNLTNSSRGPINDLSVNQLNELLTLLGKNPNSELTSVLIEGERFNNKKYKDASSFTKLVNAIVGNESLMKVLDLESEGALVGLLIKQAIALGIPKAIDALLDKISDEKLKKQLMVDSLETAARSSDLVTVNKVLDIIGVPKALARVPKLINVILTFYRFSAFEQGTSKVTLKTQLLTLLNRINPKWNKAYRDGVEINNLEPFSYASKDALSLLSTEENLRYLTMIATRYKSSDIYVFLRRAYPRAPFMGNLA